MKTTFTATILSATLLAGAVQAQTKPSVEAFLQSQPFHGVEYQHAKQFGPEDVSDFARVLADPEQQQNWAKVVWVLGVIATEPAETVLIDFLENGVEGEVGPQALQALILVPPALGFRANDPESRAFEYLRNRLDPETSARDLNWTFRGWSPETGPQILAKQSVNGLGLAGNARARAVLSELRSRPAFTTMNFLASNIDEALKLSREIEESGYSVVLPRSGQTRLERRKVD